MGSNFFENVKWGGIKYAIDTAKNEKWYDAEMKKLTGEVKQASVNDLMDEINQKLATANELAATLSVGGYNKDTVDNIRKITNEVLDTVNKMQKTTDKLVEFVANVIKMVQAIMTIVELVSKVA